MIMFMLPNSLQLWVVYKWLKTFENNTTPPPNIGSRDNKPGWNKENEEKGASIIPKALRPEPLAPFQTPERWGGGKPEDKMQCKRCQAGTSWHLFIFESHELKGKDKLLGKLGMTKNKYTFIGQTWETIIFA